MATSPHFMKPTPLERAMNKTIGMLARLGLGPGYLRLLEVQGKTTGRTYSTPVNLFHFKGQDYLVGGRGHTGWSRNALAGGGVTLRRGRSLRRYNVRPIADNDKPEILKGYLDEYASTVQKFFTVQAGSPPEAFRTIADRHPVFELIRINENR